MKLVSKILALLPRRAVTDSDVVAYLHALALKAKSEVPGCDRFAVYIEAGRWTYLGEEEAIVNFHASAHNGPSCFVASSEVSTSNAIEKVKAQLLP